MQKYLRQRKACTHMHRRCKRLWDPQGQVETPHPLAVADAARIVAAANAKMKRGPIKRKRKRGRQPKKANNTPAAKKSKTMLDSMDGASLGSPLPSVRRQRPTTSPPACRLASSQSRGMADVDGNSYLNATLQCLRRLPLQSDLPLDEGLLALCRILERAAGKDAQPAHKRAARLAVAAMSRWSHTPHAAPHELLESLLREPQLCLRFKAERTFSLDDANGSAAFVAGWEEGDEDMLQKVRMRCESVADRLPTAQRVYSCARKESARLTEPSAYYS